MLQTIMVPLDGSSFGEQALTFATALAKRTQAELHLVLVHVPPTFTYAGVAADGSVMTSWDLDNQQRQREVEYLDSQQQRIAADAGIVVSHNVLDGPIVETLITHAAERKIDVIVMGTHGRGPLVRVWLGSVTDGVLRHTLTPLLVIRPHEELHVPAHDATFHNVLLPLDGSVLAEQAIDAVIALIDGNCIVVTLLRVVEPYEIFDAVTLNNVPSYNHQETQLREQEASNYLNQVSKRIEATGARVETRVIVAQQPAGAILRAAQDATYDLIALSTHGWGGMKRLLIGSVADKLVRGGHCPTLVVRPLETPTLTE